MKRYVFLALMSLMMVAAVAQPPRHHHRYRPCASSEQMHMVMKTLEKQSFDDKRLEFLQFAYSYCTDPENYPMLREAFTFSSNYDKLMDYIYPHRKR